MKTATEEAVSGVATLTANKSVEFHVCLSDAETEAIIWSITDVDCVANKVDREIYGITWDKQKLFKEELTIHMIEFEAWWKAIHVQELRKTIKQCVIRFGYPKIHLVSNISWSIWRMGSANDFTIDISERIHIHNVKESY
jgi:hypothetical protein